MGSLRLAPARLISYAILLLVFGLGGLAACGGGGGGTPAAVSPLKVTAIDPADGALGVKLDATIRVTFSLPLDPATVTTLSIRVGSYGGQGEAYGAAGLDPDSAGTTLVFASNNPLEALFIYSILVSPSLRSTTGDALAGTKTFQFQTGGGAFLPVQSQLQPTNAFLNVGRRNHTATRLADTRVLLAGGFTQGTQITDRAERFTPADQSFATLPARMTQERAGHTATLLPDGRVLLAGGWFQYAPGADKTSNTAEIFDPATDLFTAVGNMGSERVDHAALLLPDGTVLVTGGSRLAGNFLEDLDDAEVFNPATGSWTPWPHAMAHTHATHGMVDLQDGRFLLVGGSDVDFRPELFSVAAGTFAPLAPPQFEGARYGLAASPFADHDVAFAGGDSLGTVLHFDKPSSVILNTGSGLARPRSYGTATLIKPDRILVVGGIDFSAGSLIVPSCDLVVEGGPSGSRTFPTEVFFPTGMANHTATILADGRVLFAGGLNPVGGAAELRAAYIFTP